MGVGSVQGRRSSEERELGDRAARWLVRGSGRCRSGGRWPPDDTRPGQSDGGRPGQRGALPAGVRAPGSRSQKGNVVRAIVARGAATGGRFRAAVHAAGRRPCARDRRESFENWRQKRQGRDQDCRRALEPVASAPGTCRRHVSNVSEGPRGRCSILSTRAGNRPELCGMIFRTGRRTGSSNRF
jgi:hypothetical protein